MIVTSHLAVENFGVNSFRIGDKIIIDDIQHVFADVLKLLLDLVSVHLDDLQVVAALVLLLILNC